MDIKDKIEIIKNILNNASDIDYKTDILLKISQKIDEYIVEYYRKNES